MKIVSALKCAKCFTPIEKNKQAFYKKSKNIIFQSGKCITIMTMMIIIIIIKCVLIIMIEWKSEKLK